ncbi:MAG: hypothetical protein HZC19_03550, partial [Candidatus Omnitrophica bacterium]|nr:hypothetical protein [Candidatus Omnitrophota bacterium]
MIVPMKKVTIITQSKDADQAVMRLRALGVVHVEHQEVPSGKEINEIKESAHIVGEVLNILSETKFLETKHVEICVDPAVWQPMARHIIELHKRLDHLEDYSKRLTRDIKEWEEWGDFNPLTITNLKSKNLYARLYRVPLKELKNFPPSVIVKSLSTNKGQTNCVVISQGEVEVPFKEVMPPKMSLADMRARSAENSNIIKSIRTQIQQHICYRESFLRI